MIKRKLLIVLLPLLLCVNISFAQDHSKELKQAEKYFQEIKSLSEKDNGKLWGIELYGPILFVNPKTRLVIANMPDNDNYLKEKGGVYYGELPGDVNIANTALDWKGEKWTMVMWPLPKNKFERTGLILHELFHRIQGKLNFPQYNTSCDHLDKKDGRILLRLEWQELISALKTKNQERLNHIKNAMILNKYRKELYPDADSLESRLVFNEGLAEYTGLKLTGADEKTITEFLDKKIKSAGNLPSFVRSFAYISGPLYCFLIDEFGKPWMKNVNKTTNLSALLFKTYSIDPGSNIKEEAQAILKSNKESAIVKYEEERERKHKERITKLKDKFFNNPVITIDLQNMKVQFDPRNLVPLGDAGTVYPTIRITDNWGILTVTNDALLASNWGSIQIAVTQDFKNDTGKKIIKTDSWTLELKEGWQLKPAEKKGSYILSKTN